METPFGYAVTFISAIHKRKRAFCTVLPDHVVPQLSLPEQEGWHLVSLDFQPDTLETACNELTRFVIEKNVVQFAQMNPMYPPFIHYGCATDGADQVSLLVVGPEPMRPSWRVDLLVRYEVYLGFQFI